MKNFIPCVNVETRDLKKKFINILCDYTVDTMYI